MPRFGFCLWHEPLRKRHLLLVSDYGKVVKIRGDGRYLVTEGKVADGWFGGQKIVRTGKGLPHTLPDGQVAWLNEMHRSLSAQDVESIKPYREPRPRIKKEKPITTDLSPRFRLSGLAERLIA